MNKLLVKLSITYMTLALLAGLFYREYTRAANYSEHTVLSVMHTHYFVLGMFFSLIMLALENSFKFLGTKLAKIGLAIYNISLNLTVIMLLVRGIAQVNGGTLSSGANASISGIAGLGHIGLTAGLIILMICLYKSVAKQQ